MPVFDGLELLNAYQQLLPIQRQTTIIIVLTSAGLDHNLRQL
jgi:CheY-like chemotaxis protein